MRFYNYRFRILTFVILVFVNALYPIKLHASGLEGKLISSIGISGNYPYIEGKIRRYLTIRPSDAYKQDVMNEQVKRIKNFYEHNGWIGTTVSITPEYLPESDSVYVHIKIKRGFLLRYRDIEVTGNYSLPKSIVASKINTWKPYQPRRLRESINKLVRSYRARGYPLVRARVTDKNIDLKRRRIDVTINIEEGPKVKVSFSGNRHLGGKTLKNIITIFREGAIDTFELETSASEIKKRYTIRGFPNAVVKFARRNIDERHILISFDINEGTPERVRKVEFTGNTNLKSGKIDNHIFTRSLTLVQHGIYDKRVLAGDLKRIDAFYQSEGFPDATISTPTINKIHKNTQLLINIPINEGPRFFVDKIFFTGNAKFSERKLIKAVKARPGKPLDFTALEDDKLNLKSYYADNGYPYAEISLDVKRDPIAEKADLYFNIIPGPLVTFGRITIIGDFMTSQKAIKRAMSLKEGQPFSYEKLISSKAGLRRLDVFSSIEIKPAGLDEKATVIPLTVKVEEMRPFKIDFDIGFSTDEFLIGGIDFINRNSFGWGKQTMFRLIGGKRFSRGEMSWNDPKLAGTDLRMTLAGWLQYDNKNVFSYIQGGGGIGLYRQYHRTSFLFRTNLTRNYLINGSSTAADSFSLRNNTIVNTLLSASFDTRNNFADPLRGVYTQGYANFFNEIKGKNANFVKFGFALGLYYTFANRFTLANDFRFDNIQTFGKHVSVPSNELLLLGGDDSIRGFKRNGLGPVDAQGNPTGGRIRFICNNELRMKLVGNFKWVFFHDMGWLTNSYDAISAYNLRHSVGFGLHYITPIGPIKADYGFVIDKRPTEASGRFHLTFGYIF